MAAQFSETRFWASVRIGGPVDCWDWTGTKTPKGYGRTCGRGQRGAHRISYVLSGRTLAAGQIVMHSCDNPSCVNPAHLSAGTTADNMRDRDAKGRVATGDRNGARRRPPKGERNPNAILNDSAVVAIRARRASGESLDSIAADFGISKSQASAVAWRRRWAHVPDPSPVARVLGGGE